MAQSIFFHNASDQASVQALTRLIGQSTLPVAAPLPGAVNFGVRVVVAWSQHAAAEYAADGPTAPKDAIIVQLDDTPLPASLAGLKNRIRASGDWASDADQLARTLSGALALREERPAPVMTVSTRRSAAERPPVGAARRRQTQSASMVTAAGAMGTLAAFALGAVVPAEQLVTPSFASPNPVSASADALQRHEHLAQARQMAVQAQFQGAVSPAGVSVAFSAEEIAALNDRLVHSEEALAGARGWSDSAMARLNALSGSEPEPMPSMAAVPQGRAANQMAQAAPAPRESAPAPASPPQVVLRDRFAQVEPVAFAVDRLGEILTPATQEAAPLIGLGPAAIDG
jgi:hypothetical protein